MIAVAFVSFRCWRNLFAAFYILNTACDACQMWLKIDDATTHNSRALFWTVGAIAQWKSISVAALASARRMMLITNLAIYACILFSNLYIYSISLYALSAPLSFSLVNSLCVAFILFLVRAQIFTVFQTRTMQTSSSWNGNFRRNVEYSLNLVVFIVWQRFILIVWYESRETHAAQQFQFSKNCKSIIFIRNRCSMFGSIFSATEIIRLQSFCYIDILSIT